MVPDIYCVNPLSCLIPQPFKVKDLWPIISSSEAPEAMPECRDYEYLIHAEELYTHIGMTVLHESPMIIVKKVVDLLFHPTSV